MLKCLLCAIFPKVQVLVQTNLEHRYIIGGASQNKTMLLDAESTSWLKPESMGGCLNGRPRRMSFGSPWKMLLVFCLLVLLHMERTNDASNSMKISKGLSRRNLPSFSCYFELVQILKLLFCS